MKILLDIEQITTDPTPYKLYGVTYKPHFPLCVEVEIGGNEGGDDVLAEDGSVEAEVLGLDQFFGLLNSLGVQASVSHEYMKSDIRQIFRDLKLVS